MKRLLPILIAPIALLPAAAWAASIYDSGVMTFVTQTPQSSWESGDAAQISDSKFLGIDNINSSTSVGGISGEKDGSYTINNPLYIPGCDGGLCPPKTITLSGDTRTGAKVTGSISGKVGAEVGYRLTAGEVSADLDYRAEAMIPEAGEIGVGEEFNFNPMSDWLAGVLDGQSPTAEASASAVVDLNVKVGATGCVFLLGCASAPTASILDTGLQKQEIVGIDPNQITYLDGLIPGVELSTPLLNQTASLQVTLLPAPSAKVDIEDENGGKTTLGSQVSLGVDVGNVSVQVPIDQGKASLANDQIALGLQSDFIGVKADVDALLPILPVGGVNVDLGILSVSLDAYDVEVGPKMDVFQDLLLKSDLWVDLAFDKPVEIVGEGLKTAWQGLWKNLPNMKVFEKTVFSPVFSVVSTLQNTTGLTFGFELTAELFKIGASVGAFGVDLLNATLGPLFKKTVPFASDFARVSIYDKEFALGGFNTVAGASFVVDPRGPSGVVPLPTGLPLLLGGIGLLGVLRRKQRSRPVS